MTRVDDVYKTLDLERARGLKDVASEFLQFLSAFVILRQAEIREAEQEAIAAFDDSSYEPSLLPALRWSRIAGEPINQLSSCLREVWAGLAELPATPETKHLRQIPAAFNPTWAAEPSSLMESARKLVSAHALEASQGRRELAEIFEGIVERYTRSERYPAEFSTPNNVADLIVNLAHPRLGERIYDPCFGLGGLLVKGARRIVEPSEALPPADWQQVQEKSIFGVEINPTAWLIGFARVILAGVRSPNLELGNTLERPMPRDRSSEGFDCILANIPFGGVDAAHAEHFRVKTAARDSNFLQHILGHLRLDGRAVVIVPESVLFRQGADELIRRHMLEEFHVDSVISLPAGWLEYTKVKSSILCVSRREPAKDVLFVGEQLWKEGLQGRTGNGNRESVLFELIHRRQGLIATPPQPSEPLERATTEAFINDAFDEFNPDLGRVTPSGDRERFRDYVERLDLIRQLPGAQEGDSRAAQNLLRLPELHGVRLAWTVPVSGLAQRRWELVAKETGEAALEDFLKRLEQRSGPMRRFTLADVAEVFSGVGYDKAGTVERDFGRTETVVAAMGKVPLIRVQDVGGEKAESSSSSIRRPSMYLNEKGMERVRPHHRLRVGDLLLTASGTVGNLGIVSEFLAGSVPAKSLIVIRPKGTFKSLALYRLLQSAPYEDWIRGSSYGSTIRHLSPRVIRQMPLLELSLDQQDRLAQHLREGGDTEAVLEAFSALSGESVWISLLVNDNWVRTLTEVNDVKGYTEEWWDSLRRFVLLVTKISDSSTRAGVPKDPFHEALVSWADRAVDLLDAMDVPPGMDRYGALQEWGKDWSMSTIKLEFENRKDPLTSHAAKKINALSEVLRHAANTECMRIVEMVSLAVDIADPFIPAGRSTEVELQIRNTGIAPIRRLQLSLDAPEVRHDLALLSGGSSARWVIPLPAQAPGTIFLLVRWVGRLLDGSPWSGSTTLSLESLQDGAGTSDAAPRGNPYKVGTPIDSEDRLYGREGTIQRLRDALPPGEDPAVLILSGNRRAGKTSILKKLLSPAVVPGWLPVYSDFQSTDSGAADSGFTAHALFRMLAKDVLDAVLLSVSSVEASRIKVVAGEAAPLLLSQADSSDAGPFEAFRNLLSRLLTELRPTRLLLMMDEFEKLQDGIAAGTLNPQVLDNFRALFQHQRGIATILSGSPRIKKLQEEYWGILFGLGVVEPVGPLDLTSARQLVTEPASGRLVFSPAAVDRVCELSSRQPYLIQSLCHRVFTLSNERGDHGVSPEIVEEAAQRFAESSIYFRDVFRTYIRSARQRYLVCVIDNCAKGPDRVTFGLLFARLEEAGLPYTGMALKQDLEELRELEVVAIEESVFGVSYRINVPLFSFWLHKKEDPETHLAAARLE
jgi:type I restriction enzyme M protein